MNKDKIIMFMKFIPFDPLIPFVRINPKEVIRSKDKD